MPESLQKTTDLTASDRVAALLGRMNARAAAEIGVGVETIEAEIADRAAEIAKAREPARAAVRAAMEAQQEQGDQQPIISHPTPSQSAAVPLRQTIPTGIMI